MPPYAGFVSGTGEAPYGEPPRWASYQPPAPVGSPQAHDPEAPYTERHFGPTVVSEYNRGPQATDGLAIAALVVSLLGFITIGIGFLAGLALSLVAIGRTKDRPGRGLAIAALLISGFGTLMLVAVVVLFVGVEISLMASV